MKTLKHYVKYLIIPNNVMLGSKGILTPLIPIATRFALSQF